MNNKIYYTDPYIEYKYTDFEDLVEKMLKEPLMEEAVEPKEKEYNDNIIDVVLQPDGTYAEALGIE